MIGKARGDPISITGLGAHVPERVLTNDELSTLVDTSDEWIMARTGIRERRIAAPEEALSDGPQSLKPERFAALMQRVRRIAQAVDRDL